MSNLAASPELTSEQNEVSNSILLTPRKVELTPRSGIAIDRLLPHRDLRTIGAWCFVDHFGPTNQAKAMSVAAHPHTGLQTVTWLFSGNVEHRDSVGSVAEIYPGQLNIMTAGYGISHSELSLNTEVDLHGIQIWVVLPDEHRDIEPHFNHYKNLPTTSISNTIIKVFVGDFANMKSPAIKYSPLVGAEIQFLSADSIEFELDKNFEYGVMVISGQVKVTGQQVNPGSMIFLPAGSVSIDIAASTDSKIILLGGEPFTEPIIMWWNFIGRNHDEIVEMRSDWESHNQRFGQFTDQIGGRIPAPPMPGLKLTARANKF
ncbi:MAG: pirin family protein [Candidatus Nanopelagicales bacterium]|jgi:redox-sensitive bicupin YhaK (pirin superfamily)